MLTKGDLTQIKTIVQTETRKIVNEELVPVKKDIKTIKKDVTKICSDIDIIVKSFDRDYLGLRSRVDRIEDHLGLAPLTI